MPKLAGFSGREVASILQKSFGFLFVSQRWTLRNILRQAEVDVKEFLQNA